MVGPLYVDETYTEETAAAYNAEHSAEIAEDESKAVKAGDPTGKLIPSNLDDIQSIFSSCLSSFSNTF